LRRRLLSGQGPLSQTLHFLYDLPLSDLLLLVTKSTIPSKSHELESEPSFMSSFSETCQKISSLFQSARHEACRFVVYLKKLMNPSDSMAMDNSSPTKKSLTKHSKNELSTVSRWRSPHQSPRPLNTISPLRTLCQEGGHLFVVFFRQRAHLPLSQIWGQDTGEDGHMWRPKAIEYSQRQRYSGPQTSELTHTISDQNMRESIFSHPQLLTLCTVQKSFLPHHTKKSSFDNFISLFSLYEVSKM
jgi:hypothetical protein